MGTRRPGTTRDPALDRGMTLVEVTVAILLVALIAVAMLGLFVRAMKDSTGMDRRQAAVAVASQSMEVARSIPAVVDAGPNSKLISGRSQAAVDAQWAAATAADLSQTDKAWDTTATTGAVPALPLTSTTPVAGVTYTTNNLVGTCWRPPTGGTCVKAAAKTTGSVQMYRVIVLVTWSDGAGTSCSGTACSYTLATLVDPGTDPPFNINATNASWPAGPVLTPLTATVLRNTSITIDLASAVTNTATNLTATLPTTPITNATATLLPNTTRLTITPTTNFTSGPDITLTFTLTDPYGQSADTTLTVHVTPPMTTDSFTVRIPRNGWGTIDLATHVHNGIGTLTFTVPTSTQLSTITISGSVVTYTRKNNSNSDQDSFTYTVVGSDGQRATGVVSIDVY